MKPERIRDEFEILAERLGFTVRYERGDFRGDACRIMGDRVIIINRQMPVPHQNVAFARIFARQDLSGISLLPVLREMIDDVSDGTDIAMQREINASS